MYAPEKFLNTIFAPYAAPALTTIEIRLLPRKREENDVVIQRWYNLRPQFLANAAKLATFARDEYDVYVGVLPRKGRGDHKRDVERAAWLWIDLDAKGDVMTQAKHIQHNLPTPTMIVASGSGGAHFYWRLTEVVDVSSLEAKTRYESLLRRLAAYSGGDVPCSELARILRVPGTRNHKHSPARDTTLKVCASPDVLPFEWWAAQLPFEPAKAEKPRVEVQSRRYEEGEINWNAPPEGIMAHILRVSPEGQRHTDMSADAAWLIRDLHCPPSVATNILRIKRAQSHGSPISDKEIEKIIIWAAR